MFNGSIVGVVVLLNVPHSPLGFFFRLGADGEWVRHMLTIMLTEFQNALDIETLKSQKANARDGVDCKLKMKVINFKNKHTAKFVFSVNLYNNKWFLLLCVIAVICHGVFIRSKKDIKTANSNFKILRIRTWISKWNFPHLFYLLRYIYDFSSSWIDSALCIFNDATLVHCE